MSPGSFKAHLLQVLERLTPSHFVSAPRRDLNALLIQLLPSPAHGPRSGSLMDGEVESDEQGQFRERSFMVELAEGTFSFLPWPCRCNGLQIPPYLFHCCVLQPFATITARQTSRATWGWMAARGTVPKPLGEACTSLHPPSPSNLLDAICKKMHTVIFLSCPGNCSKLHTLLAQDHQPLPPYSCFCSLNGLAMLSSSATKTL